MIYYKEEIEVNSCYHVCPFFRTSEYVMECAHPYFNNKDSYDRLIITHDNSKDTVPQKCPLKLSHITIVKNISLKNVVK